MQDSSPGGKQLNTSGTEYEQQVQDTPSLCAGVRMNQSRCVCKQVLVGLSLDLLCGAVGLVKFYILISLAAKSTIKFKQIALEPSMTRLNMF